MRKLFTFLMASLSALLAMTTGAFASTPVAQDMWDAVDLSTISGNVISILIAVIGIKLVFVAAGYIRTSLGKARG